MKTQVIAVLENAEYGIAAHVALVEGGYSVALKDADAGEFLGTVTIFKSEQAAMDHAEKLVA